MGPLYGKLFGQTLDTYFAYLATSIVVWQLVSETIRDSFQAFIGSEGFIKQVKLPLTIHVLRIVWKGLIVFAHNLVIVILVFVFFPPQFGPQLLLLPLGILAVSLNAVWLGVVVGLVCARFRDFPQIVASLISVAFFITPIMWQPHMLGRHAWTVNLNPFFHLLEVIRGPLLGSPFRMYSWLAIAAMTVVGYALMLAMFSRYRSRIAYWV
jgi:lipopolysaccharide transport system permease protein